MYRIAIVPLAGLLVVVLSSKDPTPVARPVVFRGARIHTAAGAVIDNGVLIVHKGKIVAVGAVDRIDIPADAEMHDLRGKVIIPGLVDTHSHVGLWSKPAVPANSDGNEGS